MSYINCLSQQGGEDEFGIGWIKIIVEVIQRCGNWSSEAMEKCMHPVEPGVGYMREVLRRL